MHITLYLVTPLSTFLPMMRSTLNTAYRERMSRSALKIPIILAPIMIALTVKAPTIRAPIIMAPIMISPILIAPY